MGCRIKTAHFYKYCFILSHSSSFHFPALAGEVDGKYWNVKLGYVFCAVSKDLRPLQNIARILAVFKTCSISLGVTSVISLSSEPLRLQEYIISMSAILLSKSHCFLPSISSGTCSPATLDIVLQNLLRGCI